MIKEDLIGKVFKTNRCGNVMVLQYEKSTKVLVEFLDTGTQKYVKYDNLLSGKIRNKSHPLLYGVGILGNEGMINKQGCCEYEYKLWSTMLQRAYCDKLHERSPTYKGCKTSENFNHYPYFKEWCNKQIGFGNKGWALDKDVLVKGNKVYSEDMCCFVPKEINNCILRGNREKSHIVGVTKQSSNCGFSASLSVEGRMKFLGMFSTELEAFLAYKQAKEARIKDVANKWKEQIDPRVYEALMKYQVEITD